MNLPALDPAQPPEQLAHDILAYVEKAESLLESQDTVALAGLDSAVEALCARVMALTPEGAKSFTPQLVTLMERINHLQIKMEKAQDEVARALKTLNTSKKASNAYEKNKPEA